MNIFYIIEFSTLELLNGHYLKSLESYHIYEILFFQESKFSTFPILRINFSHPHEISKQFKSSNMRLHAHSSNKTDRHNFANNFVKI